MILTTSHPQLPKEGTFQRHSAISSCFFFLVLKITLENILTLKNSNNNYKMKVPLNQPTVCQSPFQITSMNSFVYILLAFFYILTSRYLFYNFLVFTKIRLRGISLLCFLTFALYSIV